MTDDRKVNTRKPRPKFDPKNKEQGSYQNKKKRWNKRSKRPKKDLGKSLQELQSYINGEFHTK